MKRHILAMPGAIIGSMGDARRYLLIFIAWALLVGGPPAKADETSGKIIKADAVLVLKAARKMYLLRGGARIRTYDIGLGDAPVGHKTRQGDERTPEGHYLIDWRNPNSAYHLSLHISYPDVNDKRNAKEAGQSPGGDIFIHGMPNGWSWADGALKGRDWTDGCIAVTDAEIEEIWNMVDNGTPIEIRE